MANLNAKAAPYMALVQNAAEQEGIRPSLLLGLLAQESGFNPRAVSGAGARGIAQFMPATAKQYGIDPFDPKQAIPAAAKYLKQGITKYGSEELALAAYNSGFGNTDKYKGIPPFKETQQYVPAVLSLARQFEGQPPDMNMLSQAPAFQQATEQPAQNQYNINPMAFVGAPPQAMGKGLSTLLTVLGGLGALGGTAANVIGGIKGTGSPGDAAINQSSGIFGLLGKQQAAEDEYRKRLELAQNLPPELAVQALAPAALANYIGERTKPTDPIKALTAKKLQMEIDNFETAEQKAARLKQEKLDAAQAMLDLKNSDPTARAQLAIDWNKQAMSREPIKDLYESGAFVNTMNSLWSAYKAGNSGLEGKNALSQALISSFGKITDPSSVVRESEYARTPEGQALTNRLPGLVEKLKKGGAGLVDSELEQLVIAANIAQEGRIKQAQPIIENFSTQAQKVGLSLDDILPLDDHTKGLLIKLRGQQDIQKINQNLPKTQAVSNSPQEVKNSSSDFRSRYGY